MKEQCIYDQVAEVLKFYADPNNYDGINIKPQIACDRGQRAHEMLVKMHIKQVKERVNG